METLIVVTQWGVGCILLFIVAAMVLWWFNEWSRQPFPADFDFQVLSLVLVVFGFATFLGGSYLIPPLHERVF